MVEFNTEDEAFVESLHRLPNALDLYLGLQDIVQQGLSWDEFVDNHGWIEINPTGQNTYPGPHLQHWFVVEGPSGERYYLAGECHDNIVVVCLVTMTEQQYDNLPSY